MADTLEHQVLDDNVPTPTEDSDRPDPTSTPTPPSEGDEDTNGGQGDGTDGDTPDGEDTDSTSEPGEDDEEASSSDLESMTADRDRWKSFSRQWESRAKESLAKTQELEEINQKQAEELQSLHSENLRREIAAEFQVPENLLHGDDRDQMVQVAKDLSAWSQTSVRPRTSPVSTPASGRGQATTTASGGRQAAADALRQLRSRK